jgi:DNA anti-recombination protein RmuC
VQKKLDEASGNIGDVSKRSRTIESRPKKVENLSPGEAERLLPELGSGELDDSEG